MAGVRGSGQGEGPTRRPSTATNAGNHARTRAGRRVEPTPAAAGDVGAWPLLVDPRLSRVSVDAKTGVVLPEGTSSVLVAGTAAAPEIGVPRVMRPTRVAPPTEDALALAPLDDLPPPPPPPSQETEDPAAIPELDIPFEPEPGDATDPEGATDPAPDAPDPL